MRGSCLLLLSLQTNGASLASMPSWLWWIELSETMHQNQSFLSCFCQVFGQSDKKSTNSSSFISIAVINYWDQNNLGEGGGVGEGCLSLLFQVTVLTGRNFKQLFTSHTQSTAERNGCVLARLLSSSSILTVQDPLPRERCYPQWAPMSHIN